MTEMMNNKEESDKLYFEDRLKSKDIRSMPIGNDRLIALRDLGVTFDEGKHKIIKMATPTGTPKLPTFLDASQIEQLLQSKLSSIMTNDDQE